MPGCLGVKLRYSKKLVANNQRQDSVSDNEIYPHVCLSSLVLGEILTGSTVALRRSEWLAWKRYIGYSNHLAVALIIEAWRFLR